MGCPSLSPHSGSAHMHYSTSLTVSPSVLSDSQASPTGPHTHTHTPASIILCVSLVRLAVLASYVRTNKQNKCQHKHNKQKGSLLFIALANWELAGSTGLKQEDSKGLNPPTLESVRTRKGINGRSERKRGGLLDGHRGQREPRRGSFRAGNEQWK